MIAIIGHVVGKGIEAAGMGIMYGAKGLSAVTKGLFLLGGKNVDLVDTLREGNSARESISDPRFIGVRSSIAWPVGEEALPTPEREKTKRALNLVRLAIEYGTRAYDEKMLPVEEIVAVDRQARIMAKAIEKYLQKTAETGLKKEFGHSVESLENASALFMKYHRTGDDKLRDEAERMLAEASGMGGL